MMIILCALYVYAGFVGLSFLLWAYYLAVMALDAANDAKRIPPDIYRVCKIFATIGLLYDVLFNITIGSIIFVKYPQDWTLTYRLIRYKREGGVRGEVAAYICRVLLDPFAPSGCHCKP